MAYAELQTTTNFSFLRGASHPHELVEAAKARGLLALGITDRNTLAGVVRAHSAAKAIGLRLLVGCRLDLKDGPSLLCYPSDRAAYGRLCRLLTLGKLRAAKGMCELGLQDVLAFSEGQVLLVLPPEEGPDEAFAAHLREIAAIAEPPVYLVAHHLYRGNDRERIARLSALAETCSTPLIATGDVHYHAPERRRLQDVVTCIREGCTIAEAGYRLFGGAERHLKPPEEMARLFAGHEAAVERTGEIVARCGFSLDDLSCDYPDEPVPPGQTAQSHLEGLTWQGARKRYPQGLPDAVRETLERELSLIAELRFAPYFLTVHDIVQWAMVQKILCQGRGSSANSAVCYCLEITAVDPILVDLLFERFVSAERGEPPDIDVDFEHERREEVVQYVYERYGRDHAGIAATVISYRARSAVREVAKVMGLSADVQAALAGTVWGWSSQGLPDKQVREVGLDPADPTIARTLALAAALIGFPRHLSQHPGGFVLTRSPLSEVVPIGNAAMDARTCIEWDKDDLAELKILKVDILGLGMLSCLRRCFALLAAHKGEHHTLASVPQKDAAVYAMLGRADSIGVFQVESRAQMSMLPRLKPKDLDDLTIQVAIVRPGPIQGDMVHPYLRRRDGLEAVEYPKPAPEHGPPDELERILHKTKGVPLFQEQAMQLAIAAAQFTPEEANQLRYAMGAFRRRGTIDQMRDLFIGRMVARGYGQGWAERCFKQIEGFGEYGFPQSHAASFALLVYVSAWIKCHHPAVFCCGLLNAQPMGFYAPAQIVRDAREHGVEIRPVDINASAWDNTLEPCEASTGGLAVRLGFRQIKGVGREAAEQLVAERSAGYADIAALRARADVPRATLERLAAADACRSLGLSRREALWQIKALPDTAALPLFAATGASEAPPDEAVALPAMSLAEDVVDDYQTLHLSLKAHPLAFLRPWLAAQQVQTTTAAGGLAHGHQVTVAGLVIIRQRPGTAKGVIFMTIEDETGIANVVVRSKVFERYRQVVLGSRLVRVQGHIQKSGAVVHLVAEHLEDWSMLLLRLSTDAATLDHRLPPLPPTGHPRQVRDLVPKSRDFH